MNRREFLQPRRVAQVAGQVIGALRAGDSTPVAAEDDVALLRFARRAMATSFEVVLPIDAVDAYSSAEAVFDLLDELEAQLSVYRDDSEISHLNRLAAEQPVRVEDRLFELLQDAAALTAATGGAFDMTSGALVRAWGFLRGPKRVPTDVERESALQRVGAQHLAFDAVARTIRFLRPGLEINLGGIGKGYALDRGAERLRVLQPSTAFLLHGGGSSVYAEGSCSPDGRGWPIDLRHPWQPERKLGRVVLRDQALGTSASTFQHLESGGRKFGHLLDPRSGWPAEGIASASVVAPTSAEADALSTAFFVGGVDLAYEYCKGRPEIGAVLLPDGPEAVPIAINLSAAAFTLPAGVAPPAVRRGSS
jgi:thiamine biosynthesis lipoprotein